MLWLLVPCAAAAAAGLRAASWWSSHRVLPVFWRRIWCCSQAVGFLGPEATLASSLGIDTTSAATSTWGGHPPLMQKQQVQGY